MALNRYIGFQSVSCFSALTSISKLRKLFVSFGAIRYCNIAPSFPSHSQVHPWKILYILSHMERTDPVQIITIDRCCYSHG
ncbi:hypothetical protein Nepgr_015256 [Nepenthes gracilis]|uniref:Uncharacterized protein n=1 Tax=Nepenthes gracilis TaxID=150966 RepID=A0AAD3SKP8_NEPGR|nr:hypothetical protein Nepgr_015256 [Nepenthes gracilis]